MPPGWVDPGCPVTIALRDPGTGCESHVIGKESSATHGRSGNQYFPSLAVKGIKVSTWTEERDRPRGNLGSYRDVALKGFKKRP